MMGKNKRKEKRHHKIAKKMLDPSVARENKELHPEFKEMLDEAHELCQNAGGAMVSRQAIASIIITFKKTEPAVNPLIRTDRNVL